MSTERFNAQVSREQLIDTIAITAQNFRHAKQHTDSENVRKVIYGVVRETVADAYGVKTKNMEQLQLHLCDSMPFDERRELARLAVEYVESMEGAKWQSYYERRDSE